jgi:hypothetical protein
MDASLRRSRRSLEDPDFPGIVAFLVSLWGLALVVRGAYASLCPGCSSVPEVRRFVFVGSLLIVAVSVWLAIGGRRVPAAVAAVPAVVASVAAIFLPGTAFAALALPAVPIACSAAGVCVLARAERDRSIVIWVFALSAVLGAAGAGFVGFAAAMTVVVSAILGPDPLRLLLASPDRFDGPDDISGL